MKLKEYLSKHNLSGNLFSKKSGINQKAIDRIVREQGGCTLRIAKSVVRATRGEVGFHDLPSGGDNRNG